jgi:flavin-dependent dehydrogenase
MDQITFEGNRPRARATPIGKTAVVVGAGIAGLTAAGALADWFEQVVVLDRDPLSDSPMPTTAVLPIGVARARGRLPSKVI